MRIAFVMDDLSTCSNGTSLTARRYADALRAKGHEVRLLGMGATGADTLAVDERHIPVVTPVSRACGFHFAKPDKQAVARAIDGVDVVHLFLPFALEREALRQARAASIPVSAAFHLQPQNVTSNARMGEAPLLCAGVHRLFRAQLYDRVRHVHCPSEMIARDLRRNGYSNALHVISNGVPDRFTPDVHLGTVPKCTSDTAGLVHIATVGRLAPEKNQVTIIEAVRRSRHAGRIQLHIFGTGPGERALRRAGASLPNPPVIGFLSQEALVEELRRCALYVHASTVDIEAMSVIEAFACGCVPVIGEAPLSAPAAFALTERSLFPAKDAAALAERLDWWIEHPEEQVAWRGRYLAEAEGLRVGRCVEKFLAMEEAAIEDDRAWYERRSS